MIKMIALDLDGTLLKTDKSISEFTIETLQKCRKGGIKVIYATGRGGSAEERAPSRYFDGRIIMNGAVAYIDDTVIYNRLIQMGMVRNFLMMCDKYGLKTCAELSGMHYSNFDVTAEWSNIQNYQITDFSTHDIDAEKLYAVVNGDKDIEFLNKFMPDGLYMTVSRDGLAQIMHNEATKSNAIYELAKHWSIKMSEVVSFGDDLNDIDMLIKCGIGVAMGNALYAVKDKADYVCDTNDNDGVAKWLMNQIKI